MSPEGIRMNNEAYTSYPSEREILLREGCKLYILSVEHDYLIKNKHTSFAHFDDRMINIVHLFLPTDL